MLGSIKTRIIGALPLSVKRKLKRYIFGDQRETLSFKFIAGSGIEIGGLGNPVPVSEGVRVRYVDYLSQDGLQVHYPEQTHLFEPDFLEDGFILPSFEKSSVDFLIANHVLEHNPDPIAVLKRWSEVLKRNGVLFVTVPIVDRCWDKGRPVTTLQHLKEDHVLYCNGSVDLIRDRNRQHYIEHVDIFTANGMGKNYVKPIPEVREKLIEDHLEQKIGIHFHTFTYKSYRQFLEYFCSEVNTDLKVAEVVLNRSEVIGILRKK